MNSKQKVLYFLMCSLVVCGVIYFNARTIRSINYAGISDIIPNIRILAQRLIAGKVVYAKEAWIETTQGNYYPFYLPMHWGPFVISEFYRFDPRWVGFIVWLSAVVVYMVRIRKNTQYWISFTITFLFFSIFAVIAKNIPQVITVTVELLFIGYYMFLIMSLNVNNYLLTGLIFAFCLLSRYYIVLWLPLWTFVLFVNENKQYVYKTIGVTALTICLLFIFPFLLNNPGIISSIGNGYDIGIQSEWKNHNDCHGNPLQLYYGNGFAYIFYEYYRSTDAAKGFLLLKKFLSIVSISTTLLLGVWYWFIRKRIDSKIFLMASFKIFLTIFLSFLTIPYTYLHAMALFISVVIFAEQSRFDVVPSKIIEIPTQRTNAG